MAKGSSASPEHLPEPSHPFARWGAGAAISLWALGVQNFSDPWNKLGAILSPGFGYLFGQVLDFAIYRISEHTTKAMQGRLLSDNKKQLDALYKERQEAIEFGADPQIIKSLDLAIVSFRQTRIEIIAAESSTYKIKR
jgi:hypothetical protein